MSKPLNAERRRLAQNVGKAIGNWLADKKITACELSRRTGVTEASICDYRRGRKLADAWTLVRLAREMDVGVDELLGYDKEAGR